MSRQRRAAWVATWLLTRGLLLLLAVYAEHGVRGDLHLYFEWSQGLWDQGMVPGRDFKWEYPAGALPFVALPGTRSGFTSFLLQVAGAELAVDAAFCLYLGRTGRERALLVWLTSTTSLGPIMLERFDLVPSVLAALAVAVLAQHPRVSGAMLALGGTVKLWPFVLLALAMRVPGRTKALAAALATGAVLAVVFVATGTAGTFATATQNQRDRGLQVESVAATPYVLLDDAQRTAFVYRHKAWEVDHDAAGALGDAIGAIGYLAIAALLLRTYGRRHPAEEQPDLALTASAVIALLVVTDKVLSPQYLLWLVGCLAIASDRAFLRRGPVLVLALLANLTTHFLYPYAYAALILGSSSAAVILAARNLLLVLLAVLLVRAVLVTSRMPRAA